MREMLDAEKGGWLKMVLFSDYNTLLDARIATDEMCSKHSLPHDINRRKTKIFTSASILDAFILTLPAPLSPLTIKL